jgi:cation transport regulator ChaC
MLHFAYGSNMSRSLMRRRCPTAIVLGTAELPGWRFIVNRDGYATVVPCPGATVHGVLWRLTPRDLACLNAYEAVDSGLYRRSTLAVTAAGRRRAALVYIGRSRTPGRPKPGYMEEVLAAAREWALPESYIGVLECWVPARPIHARVPESGEIARR